MRMEDILQLISDLTDADECELDHHGFCQAHDWLDYDRECPHKRAKEFMESFQK